MFKIKGLDHIVLVTHSIDEMLKFYCDILGCSVEKHNSTTKLIHLRAGDQLIDLIQIEHPATTKNLDHFCLRIDPFDYPTIQNYFKSHGIETLRYGNRYSSLGYGFSFYVQDPDGNEVEFVANHLSHNPEA